MTWVTHTTFSFFLSSIFGLSPISILGSTAPDWTEDLFGVKEHRGRTHYITLWSSAFLISLVVYLYTHWELPYLLLSFNFGALTHLFLDSLTVSGVPLGTGNIRVRIGGLIRTGKLSEWVLLAVMIAVFYPIQASDIKIGFSKYRELRKVNIIDEKEYLGFI